MGQYRNPALTTPTLGTIADHVGLLGASRSLFASSLYYTDSITSKHADICGQAVTCDELLDDDLEAWDLPQLGQQVKLSPDIDSNSSCESPQAAGSNSKYAADPDNAIEALRARLGISFPPSSNSACPLDNLAFAQLSNAQFDIRNDSRDILASWHEQPDSQQQWQKHPQAVSPPEAVLHSQATTNPFSSYGDQRGQLAPEHVNVQADKTGSRCSGSVCDSMRDFSLPSGLCNDAVELRPSMRSGQKCKQAPMWPNTQNAAANNQRQPSGSDSKRPNMQGSPEGEGKHVGALQQSPQPQLECADQMSPDFAHQKLFSLPKKPTAPLAMSDFDESSSPVPLWHTFPNMRHPPMRSITLAQQELRSHAQTPQNLQQYPQTLAQSQLEDQVGGQQQYMPESGANNSIIFSSQESRDFSEFAQLMGLLDQKAPEYKPTDAMTHGESVVQNYDSVELQSWAKLGAGPHSSNLQTQSLTSLTQEKGRTHSPAAHRLSTQRPRTEGLCSAAPLGPLPHPNSTLTLQTAPHCFTAQHSNSCSPVGNPWHSLPQAVSSRAAKQPTSGSSSNNRTACRMQSSSSMALHCDSDSLQTDTFGSASVKQESLDHTSLESDSFLSTQHSAASSKVTAPTPALACIMRKNRTSLLQQDHSSGFSTQVREAEHLPGGSLNKQATSAEADSKVADRFLKATAGRQARLKRLPAHLADDMAHAQPARKAAKGGTGKAAGGKAAHSGPAQQGSARRGSTGFKLPAVGFGTLAKLQPFDGFLSTVGDGQFACINTKLETMAAAYPATPTPHPKLSPGGSVKMYTSSSSSPTSTFCAAVKLPESEHEGSKTHSQANGYIFAAMSVES